jgi:hypothetical protein
MSVWNKSEIQATARTLSETRSTDPRWKVLQRRFAESLEAAANKK